MTQGGLANSSGRTLESTIIATMTSKHFMKASYRDWKINPERYGEELLLTRVPYTSIYGNPSYTEFLIHSVPRGLDIRVECKWQQVSGSVDEKFPYLYLNCLEQMPESQVIIVADGGGAKPASLNWLKSVATEKKYTQPGYIPKSISVFTLQEFVIWANKTFR